MDLFQYLRSKYMRSANEAIYKNKGELYNFTKLTLTIPLKHYSNG